MTDNRYFTAAERAAVYEVIAQRRDMRHFLSTPIATERLARLLQAAHNAPSVGLMQPWRFIRITDPELRSRIAQLVDAERQATAGELGRRGEEFLRLKVEGVRECAELLVAAVAPDDGTVFGRRTLPRETALCSVACAIQNLWLAARAENLGLGWVSLFDPQTLARLLRMPEGAQPIAVLCLGEVEEFYPAPMLELTEWRHARPLGDFLVEDGWNALEQTP